MKTIFKTKKEETIMLRKETIWILFGLLVISAWVLGSFAPAQAVDLKCKLISMSTKAETNKIDDQEGHIVGIFERKGLMVHENGEIANELNRGVFDSIKGVTKFQGYCLQTFKDGSTMMMKHQGTNDKGKYLEASFELIKGTGRFEGIKGRGTYTGQNYESFNYLHFTGTYTLPQK
ncbi:MAG: hypothetical protein ABFD82_14555 [Syntrophaceae bacterium]